MEPDIDVVHTPVRIEVRDQWLHGDLSAPTEPRGVVLFAHGSGSSRHSPRNQFVARSLESRRFVTLLADLLTPAEEATDVRTGKYRFDLGLLADRLVSIIELLRSRPQTARLPLGLFGASTGGGAALMAAAARPVEVAAVVSRGGRPDLAESALGLVQAPTLLIVGGDDTPVIALNRLAMRQMRGEVALEIVPRATHLFEEPGALEQVAALAGDWFERHLVRSTPIPAPVRTS